MVLFYSNCAHGAAHILLTKTPADPKLWYSAVLCLLLRLLCHLWLAKLNSALTYTCEFAVRRDMLQAAAALGPFSPALSPSSAALLNEIAAAITPYFAAYRHTLRQVMVLPAIVLFFVAQVAPLSALGLALMCPLIPLFMIFIGKKAKELNDRQLLQVRRLSARFFEALTKLPFIFIFDLGKRELKAVQRMSRRWRVQTMQILYVAFLSALALEFFATVGVAFCAITLGFAVYEQGFSYADALFVLLCAPEFFLPLRRLGQNFHAKQRAVAAAESLQQLLPTDLSVATWHDDANAPATGLAPTLKPTAQHSSVINSAVSLSPQQLAACSIVKLEFTQVTLRYPDGRSGLKNSSFCLCGGQLNVLSGPSGSGKSTVLCALAGLLTPCTGSITLTLSVAQPLGRRQELRCSLSELNPAQRQALYTFVPQRPYLFYGTLRDNLRVACPDASDEMLLGALQMAGATSLLSALPQGLNTKLADNHGGISGGQARLLALTRALLHPAPLILLDEPSASLDPSAERELAAALQRLKSGHTLVVAAHRPSLIALADTEVTLGAR